MCVKLTATDFKPFRAVHCIDTIVLLKAGKASLKSSPDGYSPEVTVYNTCMTINEFDIRLFSVLCLVFMWRLLDIGL